MVQGAEISFFIFLPPKKCFSTVDFLEKVFNNSGNFGDNLKSVDFGLGDIPVLNLSDKDANVYRNGGFVKADAKDGLMRIYSGELFIGIGAVCDGVLRPKRTI